MVCPPASPNLNLQPPVGDLPDHPPTFILAMSSAISIHPNDRVFQPEHPEHGYGTVRLVEESVLSDERVCQVAFDWVPGLTGVSEVALKRVPSLSGGREVLPEEWGSVEDLQRRLGAVLVMGENSETASFIRSFTMPLPHQAFLLEKIVMQRRYGHVIADDVGMGKTIEAGLIIATLRQRDPRVRVLVLSPAGVVLQWQDEMDEHFGLSFSIAGRDFKADRASNWNSHSLVLASLDTLKQERLRGVLKGAPPFDLIVCDEAHRLTARREFLSNELYRTQNYRFVEWLSHEHVVNWELNGDETPRSPRLLLLTATPHQGDDLRFAYLLQLARPDLMDAETATQAGGALTDSAVLEECLTRTAKKRAVDWSGQTIFLGHDTKTLNVALTEHEKAVLDRLARYVQMEMRFKESKSEALIRALAMHTFQKIAASSWAALESAMQARLAKAGGGCTDAVGDDEDAASLGEEFEFVGNDAERQALEDILRMVRSLARNTKWEVFRQLLSTGGEFRADGERILIFTQFRRTQEWLAEELRQQGERVMMIHGSMALDERREQRRAFEDNGTVLICTEAGSEGSNLHRQCHLLINYDLPWNPMRLLQRTGRLDRYGQKHKVRVVNLRAPLSWDSEISLKIEAKLKSVQASMGQVADEDYATMILGGIHETINVPEVMKQCDWGRNTVALDEAVNEAVQSVLARRGTLERIFQESLGMPENYGQGRPTLSGDDFRRVFTWAAAGHGVVLRESRTSENKLLKGVYHFTLPEVFRGGLRPSRECHIVFDRERFAEVRNENMGRVRGQEIKPTLCGFGDTVTDWFFRSAIAASENGTTYSITRPEGVANEEAWWLVYVARWKTRIGWAGPDAVMVYGLSQSGEVKRSITPDEVIRAIQTAVDCFPTDLTITPDLRPALSLCRDELRRRLEGTATSEHLALFPLVLVRLG